MINPWKNQQNLNFPNVKLTTYSRLTKDQAKKHENFQLFHLGKINRNYYTPAIWFHVISVVT